MLGKQTASRLISGKLLMAIVALMVVVALVAPLGVQAAPGYDACWGQATKVFAKMGAMGEHSSKMPTPRLGLANLAKALYDAGVLAEPTLQALGQFVAAELGLSIDACM